jgi:sodium/potassium/calcium exchanger 6
MLAIMVTLALLLFFFMSVLTDRFLQPALRSAYGGMGISERMAGLTFMAFGNGGPDIVTAIVGSSESTSQGSLLPVGTLFGACLIATCLITSLSIDSSPTPLHAPPRSITRDILFYLLASITLLVYGVIGFINVPMSIVFFGYYVGYMGCVVGGEAAEGEAVGECSPVEGGRRAGES